MTTKDTSHEMKTGFSNNLVNSGFNRFDQEIIDKYFNDEGKKAIEKLLHTSNLKAQISEIDFSQQYRDYTGRKYITEKMLEDRKKQLQQQLRELEEV